MGHKWKARKLLQISTEYETFKNNPIITYCARELRETRYLAVNYRMDDFDLDIFYLFQGMIYQFQMKRYLEAILIYHRCIIFMQCIQFIIIDFMNVKWQWDSSFKR